MSDFADLAGGGRALAPLLQHYANDPSAAVIAVVPNGVPGAVEVGRALDLPVLGLTMVRDAEGALLDPVLPDISAYVTLIVVDDAVESGTAALLIGQALRTATSGTIVLAVPVCPREPAAALGVLYDDVVAVVRPLARRSLTWHYETFTPIPVSSAHELLSAHADERQSRSAD